MSRIGKQPVPIPAGVTVDAKGQDVSVKGPKGALSMTVRNEIDVAIEGNSVTVSPNGSGAPRQARAFHGMTRALINNMVEGVTKGYTKKLEIVGVGYGAKVAGPKITLKLGFANEIIFQIPQGVDCSVERDVVTVTGVDKQKVGELAAKIRNSRKPEPYNGKGVRYLGEDIRRKQGKAFGA